MADKEKGDQNDDGTVPMPSSRSQTAGLAKVPPWLSIEKVTLPQRVAGYVGRPELLSRVRPTHRRATVLKAPGGFGKTVLLAECCRHLNNGGTVAAWLRLDAQDAPRTLHAYLALAFAQAGLDVTDGLDVPVKQWDRAGAVEWQTRLLCAGIERHGAPCVLAIDELETLDNSVSLALINDLLQSAPTNLHFAIGCREIPTRLEIASLVFAGDGEILFADDLRFSKPDVARFFGPRATRREIASFARESSGWPIALRILKNEQRDGIRKDANAGKDIAENWMESRLLRGVSETDRDLLLDASLFEWIDSGLLDDVLETSDSQRRIEAIPALAGLLESVRGETADTLRLHPLIRGHCAKWRFRETPDRFRRIHLRIAKALARRGETVAAMRHANEAGDSRLIVDILESAGGTRLWIREGLAQLQVADGLLTAQLVEDHPRIALFRCFVMVMSGRFEEARRRYRDHAAKRRDFAESPVSKDIEYQLDDTIVHGALALYGCERMESKAVKTALASQERFTAIDEIDPLTRGFLEYGLCIGHNLKAEFGAALDRAQRALRCAPERHSAIRLYVNLQRGQVAMARGQVVQAECCYTRALDWARKNYLREPGAAAFGEGFAAELNLERNRISGIRTPAPSLEAQFDGSAPFASAAAQTGVILDLTRQRRGIDDALSAAEGMLVASREADLPMLVRYLASERVSLLVLAGRLEEAERAWRFDRLPRQVAGCLDLKGQSWREMEALACARLRLLIAREEFEAGRTFLHSLDSVATDRDLRRVGMRALSLAIVLEHTAGRPAAAERYLVRFLRLYGETDYARPFVRERTACLPLLETFVANKPESPEAAEARRLLTLFDRGEAPEQAEPSFSHRELQVLQRLGTLPDIEIAAALDITKAGVRYHVGNIFAKLGVHDRRTAVSRAGQIGLLP